MERNQAGVYFLGDDGALDWAIGLLESLRAVSSDIVLYCVPFSDRVERLSRLTSRYQFEIISHPSLAELDAIGRELYDKQLPPQSMWKARIFRKFYCFWGPLRRFLYLDADIVVLDGFPDFWSRALDGDLHFRYAHSDPEMVYRPGELRDRMTREYGSRAINAGLWAGAAGVFNLDQVLSLAIQAKPDTPQFNVDCLDQPFLNYCLDVSRVPKQQFEEVRAAECAWAGDPRPLTVEHRSGGRLSVRWPHGATIPAIHWAGFGVHPRTPHYRIFRHFRTRPMTWTERIQWSGSEFKETRAGRAVRKLSRWGSG